jgi:Tir chaperone protein (CesT) family
MSAPPVPTALASLAQRRGVSTAPWAQQGRLSLRIDARVRVKFMPGRRPQDVVLEARFGQLPTSPEESETLIARVMLHATAGSSEQLATVVLSPDGRQLLLQALLDGSDQNRFDSSVATFLNELDRWIAVVGANKS